MLSGVTFNVHFHTLHDIHHNSITTASSNIFFPFSVARLEALGHDVGHRLIEKVAFSKPLGREPLENVKFICQHFWVEIFGQQVFNI